MAQSQSNIVSYLIVTTLLAILGTIVLSHWITFQQPYGVTETVVLVLLLTFQVLTIVFLFVFTRVNRNQWRFVPWRLSDTNNIKIVCLTIFLIGTFIYDIFSIIATTECVDVYQQSQEKYTEQILMVIFQIFKPLYMSSQVLFLKWCEYLYIETNERTNAGTNEGTNGGTNGGTNEGTNEGTNAGTNEGTNAGTNEGTYAGTNEGTNEGTNGGTNGATNEGTNAGTNGGTNAGTNAGTNEGTNAGTNEGTNRGTNKTTITKAFVFIFASGTNLFFWFYSFLFEAKGLFHQKESDREYNISMLNQTRANECSSMQSLRDNVEIYLYPVQLQFCILATSLLLHTWSYINRYNEVNGYNNAIGQNSANLIDATAGNGDHGVQNDDAIGQYVLNHIENGQNDDVNGNNNATGGNDGSLADPSADNDDANRQYEQNCSGYYYTLLRFAGLFLMVLMVTFECLLYDKDFYSEAIYIVTVIKTVFDPSVAIVCTHVICKLKKSGKIRKSGNIDIQCVIMVITSLGLIIDATFSFISVFPAFIDPDNVINPNWANMCNETNTVNYVGNYKSEFLTISGLLLVRQTFKLIAVVLQVYLIIMLNCFYTGSIEYWLSSCLEFMLMQNFGHWFYASIVEVKFLGASPVRVNYFGCDNWLIIVRLYFILLLYFRFQSALMLGEISYKSHVRGNGQNRYQRMII